MKDKKHIVILGAGYAGVEAAKKLNKIYKKQENVEITLIDKRPYHTLMTELHEVAGSRVDRESVQIDLKKIFGGKKVKVVVDEIKGIDFQNQYLSSDKGKYEYDYLVIGLGSEPAFFGVPGVEENGFTLWSMDDALKVKSHVENMFRLASNETDLKKKQEMLTFVVAGAGFTGIETIGELAEWKKKLCQRYYIEEKDVRLMVVEALSKILPILNDKLIYKAERYLLRHGVEVLKDSPIVNVDKNSITLKNGSKISTNTLIWTCGVQGSSFGEKLGLTMGKRGRIQVNEFMQSVDYKNVYIIGDNSYFEEDSKAIPQIVETALQTAETAVHNIVADINGNDKKAFKSNYHGFMVSIGSKYAVANLSGISLSGFFAMLMKHLVNIHYLLGVAGVNIVVSYIRHEFFDTKERRTMLGGHLASKNISLWLVPLRLFLGTMWLIEGINKVKDGWLNPNNIFIVATDAASGASQQVASTVTPLLSKPPAFFTWFMDTFISPFAFVFQAMVVIAEIGIGLALIAGLFTFIASAASIFLSLNFILSAMAGKEILWFIFAAIAIMAGAGRTLGLDYYVLPWLNRWWKKTKLAKKTYLFID